MAATHPLHTCYTRRSTFQNPSLNPLFTPRRLLLILCVIFQPYLELRHPRNVLRVERNVKTCLSLTQTVITSEAGLLPLGKPRQERTRPPSISWSFRGGTYLKRSSMKVVSFHLSSSDLEEKEWKQESSSPGFYSAVVMAPYACCIFTCRLISEKEIKQFLWRASRFCATEEIWGLVGKIIALPFLISL